MKKNAHTIIFLMMFSFSHISFAQNLVPNPSFEQYSICPTNQDQISYATGWSSYANSPDYFNSCSTNPLFSVPYNVSYQQASTGSAYAGLYTYEEFGLTREFIGIQMTNSLVIGTKYFTSLKVNLVIYTDINCATNKLGILFSTISYNSSNPAPINNFAHIYTDSIITDTANWVIIFGSFVADSAYQYLIIGNFFDDINTTYIVLDSNSNGNRAYYFIDDICLSADSLDCIQLTNIPENNLQNLLTIYPNPFHDFANITINDNFLLNNSALCIYDVLGHEVRKLKLTYHQFTIQRDGLQQGIYFLQIKTENKLFTQKLIITNN
ncbi:MAG: T9SS type A sorting domain-containing protein [Bacteroidetes bacterium]|nr:T9SS type A sorting domain-containing protein [Bacteroidota bacterium]